MLSAGHERRELRRLYSMGDVLRVCARAQDRRIYDVGSALLIVIAQHRYRTVGKIKLPPALQYDRAAGVKHATCNSNSRHLIQVQFQVQFRQYSLHFQVLATTVLTVLFPIEVLTRLHFITHYLAMSLAIPGCPRLRFSVARSVTPMVSQCVRPRCM